jgi:NADP-dependent 3-hydroxy acid dehydrogenase YdfG
VKNIEPGVITTELGADMRDAETRASLVRVPTDLDPLTAPDIAEAIGFSVSAPAPAHVNVAEMAVMPVQQG